MAQIAAQLNDIHGSNGVDTPIKRELTKLFANAAEAAAGAGAGSGAFDNTGTGLAATTIQAALVELKVLIDAINAVLS